MKNIQKCLFICRPLVTGQQLLNFTVCYIKMTWSTCKWNREDTFNQQCDKYCKGSNIQGKTSSSAKKQITKGNKKKNS